MALLLFTSAPNSSRISIRPVRLRDRVCSGVWPHVSVADKSAPCDTNQCASSSGQLSKANAVFLAYPPRAFKSHASKMDLSSETSRSLSSSSKFFGRSFFLGFAMRSD